MPRQQRTTSVAFGPVAAGGPPGSAAASAASCSARCAAVSLRGRAAAAAAPAEDVDAAPAAGLAAAPFMLLVRAFLAGWDGSTSAASGSARDTVNVSGSVAPASRCGA